jgi:hypothetical protein
VISFFFGEMPQPKQASKLGPRVQDKLDRARRRLFVGRGAELELFRSALERDEPPFSVLHVYGPGGIGKTVLLGEYARLATEAGRPVVRIDGHEVQPSPHGLALALSSALGLAAGEDPIPALSRLQAPVLLIDTFEALEPIEGWIRAELLPLLPANAVTVIAGRNPPSDPWRSDPGWAELSRVISLRNLRPEESRALLAARGVPPERHEDILRFTHGHPLALSLAAEVVRAGHIATDLTAAGVEVLAPLLARFVAGAPSPLHRQALEAASVAYRTTQATLSAALGLREDDETAHQLFEWLRGLPTMEQGSQGLFPHDIVRDVLFDDLRLRDPEQLRRLSRRVARLEASRFFASRGTEQHAAFWGMMYVRRHLPSARPFFDWGALGQAFAERARPEDREGILAMVKEHEGAASAEVAARWFQEQPEAFSVFRSVGGEPAGFACHLLTDPENDSCDFDPALVAIRDYVRRRGPLRQGERVSVHRYWMGRHDYQSVTAHNTTAPGAAVQWMTSPGLAWSFVVLRNVDFWLPFFGFVGFERAEGAEFSLGPHRYGMMAHDWRAEPPAVWWESTGRRYQEIRHEPPAPQPARESVLVLSQPEFRDAVRRAYRDFSRPDLLRANPLLRSRLVAETTAAADSVSALQAVLREAAESLNGHPRDQKLYRAIWRAYIEPAPTQEVAAELLELPFSTFRRHLKAGLERVTDWLWRREVYGRDNV